jgi:large subunit ribosomal protein L29
MKIEELKQISKEELAAKIKENREKLRQMRFDLATGKVKDVREVRQLKKEIARIMTILNPKFQNSQKKTVVSNK